MFSCFAGSPLDCLAAAAWLVGNRLFAPLGRNYCETVLLLNYRFASFSSSFFGDKNCPYLRSFYGSSSCMFNASSVSRGRSSRNPRSSKRSSVPSGTLSRDSALDYRASEFSMLSVILCLTRTSTSSSGGRRLSSSCLGGWPKRTARFLMR